MKPKHPAGPAMTLGNNVHLPLLNVRKSDSRLTARTGRAAKGFAVGPLEKRISVTTHTASCAVTHHPFARVSMSLPELSAKHYIHTDQNPSGAGRRCSTVVCFS
jgi:hypothetical protein